MLRSHPNDPKLGRQRYVHSPLMEESAVVLYEEYMHILMNARNSLIGRRPSPSLLVVIILPATIIRAQVLSLRLYLGILPSTAMRRLPTI